MKNLRHLLSIFLLVVCSTVAMAETVTIGGITYDAVTKAKVATVIAKETGKYSGSVVIPETIVHNNVTCSVTSIGDGAFSGCSGLTSVTIPNSVTSIGDDAFAYCKGLKEVHISDLAAWCNISFEGLTANPLSYAHNLYLNGELVTDLVIPNSVTSIGNYAFCFCDGLTSITIPNSVTSIGDYAFSNCSGLTSITIPNSVTSIGGGAFQYCSGLTSITIPNSVTTIGDDAFGGCSGLTSVTIPNSVTTIGNWAFHNCFSLTSITIPNSVTSIGEWAFRGCSDLTSITIPNSVTSIGNGAFDDCSGLTSITIPNSVTSIGSYAFRECSSLTSITIPNSVTSIGDGAFQYCSGLTSITIPNSVTSIGDGAFQYCSGLTSITIPNSVTTIGVCAFYNCSGLTSVTIGSGVEYIYSYAFANCENLTDVYCLATTVPSTNSDVFNESYPEYMTLHVPAEAINSYKTKAPWSSFGTIVTLDGEIVEPEVKICATPVISYSNGKLSFECETEGAEFITDVTCSDIKKFYDSEINFSATYNISVYATATGYENSDTVNATLCWIENGESDNTNNIINVPAVAVLVTSANGVVTVSCSLEGETVAVYTTDGTLVGSAAITNGSATIQSGLSKGSVAIVKIGNKSVKIVVD